MVLQSGQKMATVLPDRLSNDKRCLRVNSAKGVHPHALAINESMLEDWIVGMRASEIKTFGREGRSKLTLHCFLNRPTCPVGRLPQIAIGHRQNLCETRSRRRLKLG